MRANSRKRLPFLQSWGPNLNNFQHNQIGSRRVRIVFSTNFLSVTHWLNMVLVVFGYFSSFWASLVVLALVGMSGKSKIFVCHWLIFFCQFLDLFCDCSNCPLLFFRGARHLQYLQNIYMCFFFFQLGKTRKKNKKEIIWLSSRDFPNSASFPPISSIFPLFPSEKLPLAIVGMGGKCMDFINFLI